MRTWLFRRLLALLVLTLAPATAMAQGRVYLGVDASASSVTALGATHGFPLAQWFQKVPNGLGTLAGTVPSLPTWTTITRPANPVVGTLGWDTTLNEPDIWNGSAWTQICILSVCSGGSGGGGGGGVVSITGGTIDGVTIGQTTPGVGTFTTLQVNNNLKFLSGAFLNLPTWPNSGRPASPVTGTFGWDTTLSAPEVYTGSTWTQIPIAGGALPVTNGGTGQSSFTAHGLLIGEGTSPLASMGAARAGQCIVSEGPSADPSWAACSTGGGGGATTVSAGTGISVTGTASNPVVNLLTPVSVALGGTGLTTLPTHGVLIGEGANSVGAVGVGTAGQCLISGGSSADPSWGACSGGVTGSGSGSGLTITNNFFAVLEPSPTWASYTGAYDGARASLNSFPTSAEFGSGSVAIVQALVGAVDDSSSDAGTGNAAGVAGYARAASTTQRAVGVYGQGTINAATTNALGGYFLVTNAPLPNPTASSGFNASSILGAEINVTLEKTSGGATPNVPVRGLWITGGSDVTSSNATNNAIEIGPLGSSVTWGNAIVTDDGATSNALSIGRTATGNNVSSQFVTFNSTNSGGTAKTGTLQLDPNGYLIVASAAGVEINGSLSFGSETGYGTSGQCLISGGSSAPAWGSCGTGSGGIAGVTAGTGLSGGGSSGVVTVSLAVPVTVADGGTGQTSLTAGVLLGNGTSAVTTLSGASNTVLAGAGTGTNPVFTNSPSLTSVALTGYLTRSVSTLSATGTTQGTAALIGSQVVVVTSVASGTGVELPASLPNGTEEEIWNRGTNVLLVYPNTGQAIESNGTNAPVGIAVGAKGLFVQTSSTQWYAGT